MKILLKLVKNTQVAFSLIVVCLIGRKASSRLVSPGLALQSWKLFKIQSHKKNIVMEIPFSQYSYCYWDSKREREREREREKFYLGVY